ncbi:MAG: O-linked GlcNAc transferase-like protein [Clostridiaceae bacterium]|nr:O-linked GlcNAc transferase-like protein [Clostridiaceae bacterium]
MKDSNKRAKGQYGYRNYRRKIQILKVLFGAAMIIAQLLARNLTDNVAAKNILTVMAILSVLPTANVASPLLASWRYRTSSEEFHNRVSAYESRFPVLYDLILTSKEAVMPMDAIAVHPHGVYAYCISPKVDTAKAEKFLNEMFTGHKLDPHVKIFKDEALFFKRLEQLKPASEYEDDGSCGYSLDLLKSLSM